MKNKEKYNLNDLVIEWEDKCAVRVFYKGVGLHIEWDEDNKALLESLINWLEEEYKEPPILDEKEREYLIAVIKPWRYKVISIAKYEYNTFEFIQIRLDGDGDEYGVELPNFKRGTMYKGMELNNAYTLEDLGL